MLLVVKKLDKLLITSFIPPFIVTFFIALFVFVMQSLWVYIDDIAGKGVGFFLLTEVSRQIGLAGLVPAPIAVWLPILIASLIGLLALLRQEDG